MISHQNIIANTMQLTYSDQNWRGESHKGYRDIVLGVLPMSHIYSLVVICHASTYRGDRVIVLSKFEMQTCLRSIEKYKISILYIVPPIIISMVKNHKLLQTFDLHSVQHIFTGAAPLGGEVSRELSRQFPAWKVRQSYGLTESCSVFCSTNPVDVWLGSSGCLLPGCEAKLIDAEGKEITSYDQPGELLVKTVSLTLGYFQNEKATVDTFIEMPEGRYLRTGDEVMVRKGPSGNDHIWILDRIKELIKVNVSDQPLKPQCPSTASTVLTYDYRVCRLHQLSWKLVSSITPGLQTVL
jgi:ribosome assembly protein SQT1